MKKIFKSFILFILLFLTSCNSLPTFEIDPSLDYSSFKEYYLDNINNFYLQEEETYGIYLYRVGCESCNKNKNVILNHLNEYKNGNKHFKVYIYNTIRLKEEGANYISDSSLTIEECKNIMVNNKVSTLKDTIINLVPSLYIVNNGVIYDYIAGGVEPAKYLISTTLDSRSYSDFNNAILKEIEEFYTLNYKRYYIYLYFDTCPHCFKVKPTLLNYLSSPKNKEVPIFTFNVFPSSSEEGKEIRNKFKVPNDVSSVDDFKNRYVKENIENKVNKVSETYFRYVPSLFEISDNHYSACYIGEDEIIEKISF